MKKVYIVAAKRTAIGGFMGSLTSFTPGELGAKVIKQVLEDTKVDPANLDSVIVGNVLSAAQKQGVGRQAAILGGVPEEVPAYSIDMVCGSGMKSVMNGYTEIAAGMANLIIAGGTENMSNAGFMLPGTVRTGHRMGELTAIDHMVYDGLTEAFSGVHMGITAENIAEKYGISREAQDEFAYASQQKAIKAVDAGEFDDEIVPVEVVTRRETFEFKRDEHPNRTSTPERLAKLRPAFKADGTVTAGSASGINDGASFVMLASEEAVKKYNLKPMAEIIACGQGGVDPQIMGMGPVPAIRMALKNAGMKLSQMELLELNEAFASQSLGVIGELIKEHGVTREWVDERCNLNGGAIALGHPIGASGNRILVSLIYLLAKRNLEYGLASLCIGGGMGTALVIRNVNKK